MKTDTMRGLSASEITERQAVYGRNVIDRARRASFFTLLARQFKNPLIIVLAAAGIVTMVTHEIRDALFIFCAVIVNAALGLYQENKAERALAELKTYLRERCRVIRGGVEQEIDATELVPGDIIRLAQGDRVGADAILLFTNDLHADESVLTGETLPSSKSVGPSLPGSALGDRAGEVFAGTLITQGVGTAVVTATGFETEFGAIAVMVGAAAEEATPLQKSIKRLSLITSAFLVVLTAGVFVAGLAYGYGWSDMFLTSVALAVSAIPEGLPVALTVILAIGVQRMARRKGVIRRLVAAEALGSATVILTDKTGTLTTARMEIGRIMPYGAASEGEVLSRALRNTAVLVENPDEPPNEWRLSGRFIETSLVRSAALRGLKHEMPEPIATVPFEAAHKYSVSLAREAESHVLTFLGAPDVLVERATLSSAERADIRAAINAYAAQGELVLGVAKKTLATLDEFELAEHAAIGGLEFEGLITLRDPIRPGVAEALKKVADAGIRTVLLTGDHLGTALSVARGVGIEVGPGQAIEAEEMRSLSDAEFRRRVGHLVVIARVAPLDKLRVLKVLQERGEVVAMTGDGVNDAPSIKQADIGIAMGSGTTVARDVSDLVLLDDNYETIAAAVEEGRRIVHAIRGVIVYLFSSVLNEMILVGGALFLGLPLPLSALQLLWINFFADSFPAVAFAFEPSAPVLARHPEGGARGLFGRRLQWFTLGVNCATSAFFLVSYAWVIRAGFERTLVQSAFFAGLGTYTLALAFSVRSLEKKAVKSFFGNPSLVYGTGVGFALILAAVYVPALQKILGTSALSLEYAALAIFLVAVNLGIVEIGKRWYRRSRSY